jgi:DNA replicative helicase MCM subunit Mcm2 (Cdc46/Mcm family)
LTEEVSTLIAHYYSDVRKKKGESTINPRTLESIKRLTLASARIRMHELTDKEDFENARELIDMYLKQFGYDLDAISGITKSVRDSMIWIRNLIGIHGTIGKEEIFAAAKNDNVNERTIERAIDAMYRSGLIFEAGPGRYGVL